MTINNTQFKYHRKHWARSICLWFAILLLVACATEGQSDHPPEKTVVILATTTSTQDSGLLDELEPLFEDDSGYVLKVIAVGTGQALKMGARGSVMMHIARVLNINWVSMAAQPVQ